MPDYSRLMLRSFSEEDVLLHFDEVLGEMAVLSPDFLFQEMLSVLEVDYASNMRASLLLELELTSRPGITRCLFFAPVDGMPGYYTERSGLESFEMRYTLEGAGQLEYGGKRYDLGPGDGFLIDSSKSHRYSTTGDHWLCTVAQIDGPFVRQVMGEEPMSDNVVFSSAAYPRFEEDQYDALRLARQHGPASEYQLAAAIDTLLSSILGAKAAESLSRSAATADLVLAHLREHYREDVNFDDVAERLYVSRATLFSAFKAATGDTPYNYLLRLRMKRARLLLKATTMTVGEVAADVGFKDQGHFGQLFKRVTGMTPLQYRKHG